MRISIHVGTPAHQRNELSRMVYVCCQKRKKEKRKEKKKRKKKKKKKKEKKRKIRENCKLFRLGSRSRRERGWTSMFTNISMLDYLFSVFDYYFLIFDF